MKLKIDFHALFILTNVNKLRNR